MAKTITREDLDRAFFFAVSSVYEQALVRATPGTGDSGLKQWETISTGNFTYIIRNNNGNVLRFLEYGTGLYGPKHRYITAKHKTKSGQPGFLRFKVPAKSSKTKGPPIPGNRAFEADGYIYTQKSRGIKARLFVKKVLENPKLKRDFKAAIESKMP